MFSPLGYPASAKFWRPPDHRQRAVGPIVGPVVVRIHRAGDTAETKLCAGEQRLAVDRHRDGLAQPNVLHDALLGIEAERSDIIGRKLVDVQFRVVLHDVILRLVEGEYVDLSGPQIGEADGRIRDHADNDAVEIRHVGIAGCLRKPPVRIALELDEIARTGLFEHVGTGALRLPVVLLTQFSQRLFRHDITRHVGDDAGKAGPRFPGFPPQRGFIDHFDRLDRRQPRCAPGAVGLVDDPVHLELDGLGRQLRAVVEGNAVTDRRQDGCRALVFHRFESQFTLGL